MASEVLIEMQGITKKFPGVVALNNVSFRLCKGEIHTLMGENGAGKSTLIKALTGVFPPESGKIKLTGRSVMPRSPQEAQNLGISTVYQEVNLVPYLSVAENVCIGRMPTIAGVVRWREMARRARTALARLGLDLDVWKSLNSYSIAIQQMVAIARALDYHARVLVLDEPTSSLDSQEVEQLFSVMRNLKCEGLGIVFVSHFLDQVYAISDKFTVLRNGSLVGEYDAQSLPRLELISKMIGKDVSEVEKMNIASKTSGTEEKPIKASIENFGKRGMLENVDFKLRAGEVVGLAGLLGSGRTETAKLLFGIEKADHGSIQIDGKPRAIRTPRQAMKNRMAFCPEDRKTEAIIPNLSVRENIILALQSRRGWLRPLSHKEQDTLVARFIKSLGIATPNADKPVGQLSGGNQQKVIVARWLASDPNILILDEPTRGIDVGAKSEIEKLISALSGQGVAILFISSELEEIARDSHRVVVLRDRKMVGELTGDSISTQAIMEVIASHATA
jgi:simple sugar transport system ATP-binding protein